MGEPNMVRETLDADRYTPVLEGVRFKVDPKSRRVCLKVSIEKLRAVPVDDFFKGNASDHGRINDLWAFLVNQPPQCMAADIAACKIADDGTERKPALEVFAVDAAGNIIVQSGKQTFLGAKNNVQANGLPTTRRQLYGWGSREAIRV